MLEAKELRIGNNILFSDDSTIFEVVEIDKNGLHVKNDNEETWIELENFEGIKLTEEILMRLGFISNPYQDRYELDGINVECNKLRKDEITLWIEFMPHIKNVHQLQNLYFILKNKELTLKPLLLPHKTII